MSTDEAKPSLDNALVSDMMSKPQEIVRDSKGRFMKGTPAHPKAGRPKGTTSRFSTKEFREFWNSEENKNLLNGRMIHILETGTDNAAIKIFQEVNKYTVQSADAELLTDKPIITQGNEAELMDAVVKRAMQLKNKED